VSLGILEVPERRRFLESIGPEGEKTDHQANDGEERQSREWALGYERHSRRWGKDTRNASSFLLSIFRPEKRRVKEKRIHMGRVGEESAKTEAPKTGRPGWGRFCLTAASARVAMIKLGRVLYSC
jgi:hypothetical protein